MPASGAISYKVLLAGRLASVRLHLRAGLWLPRCRLAANSDEITVHQSNYVLSRNPGLSAETALQAKRESPGRLVTTAAAPDPSLPSPAVELEKGHSWAAMRTPP